MCLLIYVVYGAFFGVYAAAVTHVALFHRYEIVQGFKSLWRTLGRTKRVEGENSIEQGEYKDVHNRLMGAYPEGNNITHIPASDITES